MIHSQKMQHGRMQIMNLDFVFNGLVAELIARADHLASFDPGAGHPARPRPQTGSPMTYVLDGAQYIVVAVSGGGVSGELVAYRLPE